MTKYAVKTGGKLYLAGEYAILTPGQQALIKNIPIYLTGEIDTARDYQLYSDMFDYAVGLETDDNYSLIQETIAVVHDFIKSQGLEPHPFRLSITGKLEKDGKKFGIGSSGSVTILVVKALAAFYEQDWSVDLIFKLATYVLLKRGDNGSMGDLACIAYEDLVLFKAFDRAQVRSWIAEESLVDVLAKDWGYQIEIIKPALAVDFLVGWTGQPAISKDMIKHVKSAITADFLEQTQAAVKTAASGLETGNKELIKTSLQGASHLLKELHPAIYTEELLVLEGAVQDLDAVAKSSGSGGGDCGIALSFNSDDSQKLIERWQVAGIELLFCQESL
ncbi:phosphomevalonate kinase [Streptococcus criceti]|uniref:phosphomevalonate kinase n=1 Tax=Streptococcus criceti HS-6 TaxID=873449 RepID=G5JNI3_STRCG|nr:phosphomevalonate kinase [Streptococcus criceti]EHI75214.1 phosphomevalonate kinase [Streptococcus criceti HS-6]SUN43321.1 phosphomevalonate kinase [Streptococcus criceti]